VTPPVTTPSPAPNNTAPQWINFAAQGAADHTTPPSIGTLMESVSAPGLTDVYEQVFTASNVALGPWVDIKLDASGAATFKVDLPAAGDYLNVINDPNNVTWQGWSAQAIGNPQPQFVVAPTVH
jgi:hypothetical protein